MVYDIMDSQLGQILVAKDEQGVRHISFDQGIAPLVIDPDWSRDMEKLKSVTDQLKAYFARELTCFEVDIAPGGTPFSAKSMDRPLSDSLRQNRILP